MNIPPDPRKHCLCTGDKQMRYSTDNRGNTRLLCMRCGKAQQSDSQITFKPEQVPA